MSSNQSSAPSMGIFFYILMVTSVVALALWALFDYAPKEAVKYGLLYGGGGLCSFWVLVLFLAVFFAAVKSWDWK